MELLVLGLVATIGFASYALWSRTQAAAPEGEGDLKRGERTPSNMQVGDIVQHLGTDFLVEGSLTLAEEDAAAGPGPRLYRMVDGGVNAFCMPPLAVSCCCSTRRRWPIPPSPTPGA